MRTAPTRIATSSIHPADDAAANETAFRGSSAARRLMRRQSAAPKLEIGREVELAVKVEAGL
jgi:hypothetical protein